MYGKALRFLVQVIIAAVAAAEQKPNKDWLELAKVVIGALGPIIAALIVGVAGAMIAQYYADKRERAERDAVKDRHEKDLEALGERYKLDKEVEWRSHAVELTKLEIQRKLTVWAANQDANKKSPRIVILDFLAVYRDLMELDKSTPKDLYQTIKEKRISQLPANDPANPPQGEKPETPTEVPPPSPHSPAVEDVQPESPSATSTETKAEESNNG